MRWRELIANVNQIVSKHLKGTETMTDQNPTTNVAPVAQPEVVAEQPKKADVFAIALREKATQEPYKHDSYIGTILNAIADVVDSVSK